MFRKRVQGTIFGLLFIILSIAVYTVEISSSVISFAMGLLACVAVILMVAGFEDKFSVRFPDQSLEYSHHDIRDHSQ